MTDDSDGLPDLPPTQEMQDLFSAYRAQTHRSGAQVESALQSVSAQVGATGAAATATGVSTAAKVGLAATLLGIAGAVGLVVSGPKPQAERTTEPVTATASTQRDEQLADEPADPPAAAQRSTVPPTPPPALTEQAPLIPAEPSKAKTRARPNSGPKAKVAQTKPAPTGTLAEELRRLQQVRAALRAGTPEKARALIDSHRRDYPQSVLAQERDATEVAALCALDRDADAKRKATAFARAYPGSSQDLLAGCDG